MQSTPHFYEAFARAFEIPVSTVTEDLEYQGIAEWDSTSHLLLVTELETQYGISIAMEDILEMGSVEKIRDILIKYDVQIPVGTQSIER